MVEQGFGTTTGSRLTRGVTMSIPLFLKRAVMLAFVISSVSTFALAESISAVVVYGDSLSDNGNLFAATGQPTAPYLQGRKSDGPVAVEQLAAALGVPLIDVAWIGATSGIGNYSDCGTPTSPGL